MMSQIRKIKYRKFSFLIISIGVAVILYGVIMHMRMPFNTGIILVYLCGVAITLIGFFIDIILTRKWIIAVIGGIVVVFVCLISIILVFASNCQVSNNEDAIIILGAGIDGHEITPQLAERLDAGIRYYNENPEVIIVVSGGQGYGETTSEAVAMKQYLISKGVPESAVLTEERSTSTYSNLNNSKQILDDYFETEYTVVIVTNKYHTFRAARIAQKTGMKFNILCANTPSAEIPLRYLRECASICKYCFITMLEFFKVHKYAQLPIFSWAQIFTLLLFYS